MKSTRKPGSCVFCDIRAGALAADHIHEDADTLSFLDHNPLFPGHCLVIPRAHHVTLPDLPMDLLTPLFAHARLLARGVEEALGAEGSFVAVNNKVSQSVPHLHVHVIPRRKGDGMKGFFWPRHDYGSDFEREDVRARLAAWMRAAIP
jgi:histidine triad (HIT) family protein